MFDIRSAPARADIWSAKGSAERVLRRHADAEASFRRGLALSPSNPEILNNLGVAVRAQKRFEEAVAIYREALRIDPTSGNTHANLGNALATLGEQLRSALA